jgi:aromatase
MTTLDRREVGHDILVMAPAAEVYRLIAEVENWPLIFPPTVHVRHLERSDRQERLQIWATANGQPKSWTSRRVLDPEKLSIAFQQEVPAPPVAAMGGTWLIEPGEGGTRVRLLHDYRAIDDDPDSLAWIDQAVDRNSQAELAALKATVESAVGDAVALMVSF